MILKDKKLFIYW